MQRRASGSGGQELQLTAASVLTAAGPRRRWSTLQALQAAHPYTCRRSSAACSAWCLSETLLTTACRVTMQQEQHSWARFCTSQQQPQGHALRTTGRHGTKQRRHDDRQQQAAAATAAAKSGRRRQRCIHRPLCILPRSPGTPRRCAAQNRDGAALGRAPGRRLVASVTLATMLESCRAAVDPSGPPSRPSTSCRGALKF